MRILPPIAAGLALATLATPGLSEGAKIYRYAIKENYCPIGLQPITIEGVICCGVPNQDQSYQQALSHPAGHKIRRYARRARAVDTCAEGVKGCY